MKNLYKKILHQSVIAISPRIFGRIPVSSVGQAHGS